MCVVLLSVLLVVTTTSAQQQQNECRLIFSINPGRSGSGYLARVLALAQGVDAGHERHPTMFQKVLVDAKVHGLKHSFEERSNQKLAAIDVVLQRRRVYAETSHAFIKTFWDVVMNRYRQQQQQQCRIDVIVLMRPATEIVCSLYRRNWTAIHRDWLIEPGTALSTAPNLDLDRPLAYDIQQPDTDSQKPVRAKELDAVIWYLYDHWLKQQQFCAVWQNDPHVYIHTRWLSEIQTRAGVKRLFRDLDLSIDPARTNTEINHAIGSPYNANAHATTKIACSSVTVGERAYALMQELRDMMDPQQPGYDVDGVQDNNSDTLGFLQQYFIDAELPYNEKLRSGAC
jgi:hypothetical protein